MIEQPQFSAEGERIAALRAQLLVHRDELINGGTNASDLRANLKDAAESLATLRAACDAFTGERDEWRNGYKRACDEIEDQRNRAEAAEAACDALRASLEDIAEKPNWQCCDCGEIAAAALAARPSADKL